MEQASKTTEKSGANVCPACWLKLPGTADICPIDQTPVIDSSLLPAAAIWDRYQFIGIVGQGGMGVIYKARNLLIDRIVAIKMLHTHVVSDKSLQRFQLEGKALNRLNHPNIVTLHDFGITEQNRPYMIMDYLEGETLDAVLRRETALPEAAALDIFNQIADGMAYAHAEGVLHRDLKPSNIMLLAGADGAYRAKIFDFGIAKLMHEDSDHKLTKTGEMIGSPAYMSPEQIMDKEVDHRSDLYSFGVLMYEALTGKPPFTESSLLSTLRHHLNEKAPSLYDASQKTFLPELEAIVMRLLSKEPSARYQSMAELKSELDRAKVALEKTSDNRRFWHAQLHRTKVRGKLAAPLIAVSATVLLLAFISTHTVHRTSVEQPAPYSSVSPASTHQDSSSDPVANGRKEVEAAVHSGAANIYLENRDLEDNDLSPLKEVTNAITIDLSGNHAIDDKGLNNLEHVAVQQIYLDHTNVKTLDWLRKKKTITLLRLKGTKLSKDGYKNIATLAALENLTLDRTTVNDENLRQLSRLKKLKMLYLQDCASITDNGVAALHQALPECKIFQYDSYELIKKYGDQAEQLQTQGRWSDALTVYKVAEHSLNKLPTLAKYSPNYCLAQNFTSQGECYMNMGRYEDAIKCCERGEKLAHDMQALKVLRQLYQLHGRIEGLRNHRAAAEIFFRDALKLPSFTNGNASLHYLLGKCLLDQNKLDDARNMLMTALQEMPTVNISSDKEAKRRFALCSFYLADAETKLGNNAAAVEDLQKSYEYRLQEYVGECASIMSQYAQALEKTGRLKESQSRWQELKQFCEKNPTPQLDNVELGVNAALKRIDAKLANSLQNTPSETVPLPDPDHR